MMKTQTTLPQQNHRRNLIHPMNLTVTPRTPTSTGQISIIRKTRIRRRYNERLPVTVHYLNSFLVLFTGSSSTKNQDYDAEH